MLTAALQVIDVGAGETALAGSLSFVLVSPGVAVFLTIYIGQFRPSLWQGLQAEVQTIWTNCARFVCVCASTSSTAQGGGGSFKNRKPIGKVGRCEPRMAERIH